MIYRYCLGLAITLTLAMPAQPNSETFPLQGILPKEETGAIRFLEEHPIYDGQGITVAIFDTGVHPGGPGGQTTSPRTPKNGAGGAGAGGGAGAPARVDEILLGMAAGGYIHRREQEELLRGAAAAGLSAEDQANLAAGSDSLAVQQQAQDSSADAVVAGAAGAAAFLAHSTRAVLRDASRRDDAS